MFAEDRELARVDPCRAELSGMVDPYHPLDQGLTVWVARQATLSGLLGTCLLRAGSFGTPGV